MWTHHLPARLEGLEVFGRALHTTPLVGVASTVVPGCTSAIATCADSKTRRAAPHRPAGTAGSSATRRAAPAPQEASGRCVVLHGYAWVLNLSFWAGVGKVATYELARHGALLVYCHPPLYMYIKNWLFCIFMRHCGKRANPVQ